MAAWLASAWGQIWPNLAANVLWVPLAALHHRRMKRHIRRLHEEHREQVRQVIQQEGA